MVVDRNTLMDVLDGNVSGTLYTFDGRTWDVNQVYTGKITDFSSRNSGNTCDIPTNLSYPFIPEGFNSDISMWDMSSAQNLDRMFACNTTFNQPLNNWDVSNVESFDATFAGTNFNQPLNNWDMRNAIDISSMFQESTFNNNIAGWVFEDLQSANKIFFENTTFNQPIDWNFSQVASNVTFELMFSGATAFNSPIIIDTNKVNNMRLMFENALNFNQSLNHFDVSNVVDMFAMFRGASSFNQDLTNWVFSPSLSSMDNLFEGASNFNGDITTWNTSAIGTFKGTWKNASSFNQDLSGWCVSSVDRIDDIEDYDLGATSWQASNKPDWPNCP